MTPIDWTIFDQYPENTVECWCGATYRSHTKLVAEDDGQFRVRCRKLCPVCEKEEPVRVSSDPEIYTIGKKDI